MYGWWYLVIASGVLIGVGIFLWSHGYWCMDNAIEWGFGIALIIIFFAAFLISIVLAISDPISAKREYLEFIEQKAIIEQVIESGDVYDNISISQSVIEANKWLAKAKASKKSYGCFSKYYKIDLDDIDPINILKKEQGDVHSPSSNSEQRATVRLPKGARRVATQSILGTPTRRGKGHYACRGAIERFQ